MVTYDNTQTEVLPGDHVEYKVWVSFWRGWQPGRVYYVPGISPKNSELERDGMSSLDPAIDQLLEASRQVVAQLAPWKEARPAPPPRDHARLSFLTPSGLHFGQGPMDVLARDPLGAQVLQLASELMRALIAKTNAA
jgi:hypothetical protein